MSNLSKYAGVLTKFVGSILITGLVVLLLQIQGEHRKSFASESFDSLRNTLISMLPAEDANAKQKPDEPAFVSDVEKSEDTGKTSQNVSIPRNLGNKELTENQIETEVIRSVKAISENVLKSGAIVSTDGKFKIESPKIKNMIMDHEITMEKVKNRDYESLGDFVSSSITIALNEAAYNLDFKKIVKDQLANADKFFDMSEFNFEDIANIATRVRLVVALDEKARRIGEEMGGGPNCNYHKPAFNMNEKLEIVGFNQACTEAHPEAAKKVLSKIKRLPEWKKLVKNK